MNRLGSLAEVMKTFLAVTYALDAHRELVFDEHINLPVLKRHCKPTTTGDWSDGDGQTGVTLGGKSHCGTVGSCGDLHQAFRDWNEPMGSYTPLVLSAEWMQRDRHS